MAAAELLQAPLFWGRAMTLVDRFPRGKRRSGVEMSLEHAADLRAATVELNALVRLGQPQRLADLTRGAAFDVAHRDDDPLDRRQRIDRARHPSKRLLRK